MLLESRGWFYAFSYTPIFCCGFAFPLFFMLHTIYVVCKSIDFSKTNSRSLELNEINENKNPMQKDQENQSGFRVSSMSFSPNSIYINMTTFQTFKAFWKLNSKAMKFTVIFVCLTGAYLICELITLYNTPIAIMTDYLTCLLTVIKIIFIYCYYYYLYLYYYYYYIIIISFLLLFTIILA